MYAFYIKTGLSMEEIFMEYKLQYSQFPAARNLLSKNIYLFIWFQVSVAYYYRTDFTF